MRDLLSYRLHRCQHILARLLRLALGVGGVLRAGSSGGINRLLPLPGHIRIAAGVAAHLATGGAHNAHWRQQQHQRHMQVHLAGQSGTYLMHALAGVGQAAVLAAQLAGHHQTLAT